MGDLIFDRFLWRTDLALRKFQFVSLSSNSRFLNAGGGSVAANSRNTGFKMWGSISGITFYFYPCGSGTTRQNLFAFITDMNFVVQ
jgi:hypothetical protein